MNIDHHPIEDRQDKKKWTSRFQWRLLIFILLPYLPALMFPMLLYNFLYKGAFESFHDQANRTYDQVDKSLSTAYSSANKILAQNVISLSESLAEQLRLLITIKNLEKDDIVQNDQIREIVQGFHIGLEPRVVVFNHKEDGGRGRILVDPLNPPDTPLSKAMPEAAETIRLLGYADHLDKIRESTGLSGQSESMTRIIESDSQKDSQPNEKLVLITPIGSTPYSLCVTTKLGGRTHAVITGIAESLEKIKSIGRELEEESTSVNQKASSLLLLFAVIVVILVFILTLQGKREIADPIDHLRETAEYIRRGEYHRRANVPPSSASLYLLGESINNMLDTITNLIQSEESKIQLQRNIIEMLDIVSAASRGDLTQRANVTTDILGSVADAFNMMLDEMSKLIIQVRHSGLRLSRATVQMLENANLIAQGSKRQGMEIHSVSSKTLEVAREMQRVFLAADFASTEAEKASQSAQAGAHVIDDTMANMGRIRSNMQATSKTIKGLGERSQEVNAIVELISDISDRTNILSLNAAIEAGKAGEQGKGFAIVADEIRKLAERTTAATKEISLFIEDIQVETKDAVLAMEEVVYEVEQGWKQTEQAGMTLKEIDRVVFDAAKKIKEISESARRYVKEMDEVVGEIQSVYQVSRENLENIERTTRIVEELEGPSAKLNQALRLFKVQDKFLANTDLDLFATGSELNGQTPVRLLASDSPHDTSVTGVPVFNFDHSDTGKNPSASDTIISENLLASSNADTSGVDQVPNGKDLDSATESQTIPDIKPPDELRRGRLESDTEEKIILPNGSKPLKPEEDEDEFDETIKTVETVPRPSATKRGKG